MIEDGDHKLKVLKSARTYDIAHSRVDVITLPDQNGEFGENLFEDFSQRWHPRLWFLFPTSTTFIHSEPGSHTFRCFWLRLWEHWCNKSQCF